jgi:hypothetical protein
MTPAQLEDLIRESLQAIVKLPVEPVVPVTLNTTDGVGSKLIFPKTRTTQKQDGKKQDDGKRVSEQEARFLFVHKLEQDTNAQCLYSVEAPTKELYQFKGVEAPIIGQGQSGSIDVCLYNLNGNREHLIEFKALNPEQKAYSKDFLKLICDEGGLTNYFVQVIENTDSGTIPNIEGKYKAAIANAYVQAQAQIPPLKQSNLVIFLYVMKTEEIIKYKVDGNGYEVDGNGKEITKYSHWNNTKQDWTKVETIPIPIPPKN